MRRFQGWRRNRMAPEAKVITPWSRAITVAVEPMRPWRSDGEKQDCELGAFRRMERRLKRIFGWRGVIPMCDALYACKNESACRAMHLLMQFAHNVWHVFNSGFLENLSTGCRKVSQGMWGRKICEALHYYDYSMAELETVYLNHEYEDICRSTS